MKIPPEPMRGKAAGVVAAADDDVEAAPVPAPAPSPDDGGIVSTK